MSSKAKETFYTTMFLNLRNYFFLPFSEAGHEQEKLDWIVRLRWLVIVFLVLLAPFGLASGLLAGYVTEVYTGVVGLLFCFNLLTRWGWLGKRREVKSRSIAFHLIIDLAALTSLLSLTGGVLNPFFVLFFINISLGATLLDGRWSLVFLVLCHQALAIVQAISYFAHESSHFFLAFPIQHIVLLISWGVNRSLGRYIAIQKEKLNQAKIFSEKIDRLRALGAMTAGFSHEFASPLNTVKLRLDRELRAHPHSQNLQEMNMAVFECESVIRQMNSAQLDPRDFQFKLIKLSLVTDNILSSWSQENSMAKTIFRAKSEVDKVRLPILNYSQALMNLLDNAFEANPHGSILITIEQRESHVILSVENEGSSFSQDILQRFGEPFVTTKASGTGLGLYSVQLFAQSSGGKAFISNSKAGAKVEIHFPQLFDEGGSL
jgi:two-component system sensor histidine kinase RegB